MKKNELKSLRQETLEKLLKMLSDKKEQLFSKKIDIQTMKEKNLKAVHNLSKDIAKISTLINEKRIAKSEESLKED